MSIRISTATRRGLRARTVTAAELRDWLLQAGRDAKFWQSFGHVNGEERFSANLYHYNPEADRVEHLNSAGQVVVAYPVTPAVNHATPGRMLVR